MEKLGGPPACIKNASKARNWQVANHELFLFFLLSFLFFFLFVLSKRFIARQLNQRSRYLVGQCPTSRYCCINNTNELHLLVSSAISFGWKIIDRITNYTLYTSGFERKQYDHRLRHFLLLYSRPISYRVSILLREGPFTLVVSRLCRFNPFLTKRVETQTTNQRQCDHGQWPEANVGQQYR